MAYAEKNTFYASVYLTTMKSAKPKKCHVFLGGDDLPSLAMGTESLKTICSHSSLLFESNRIGLFQGEVLSEEAVACFPDGLCIISPYS